MNFQPTTIVMKRIIFSMLLVLFAVSAFCQQNIRAQHDQEYYLRKSRQLQTTGWILAGTGAAAGVIGIIMINNTKNAGDLDKGLSNAIGGVLVTTAGGAAVIASVPMFIFSGVMKKRAAMFNLKSQSILMPAQNNFTCRIQPAISLSIRL